MLTPLEIHSKEFKKGFRGYTLAEVDDFLDQIVRDMEQLLRESEDLRNRLAEMELRLNHYRALEQTLQNTLVMAQATADEVKSAAHKEAELIIRETEARGKDMLDEARSQVACQERECEELRKQMLQFRTRNRAMLQAYLELLDEPDDLGATKIRP
ncbi:MAG TPA: septum formation initiator [Clostridiales bacterium UBA8153]|nr:septum formation initiator [Clostridiales bacterium UBA8153]